MRCLCAAVCLLLAPASGHAQTPEIQREVDTLLWYLRVANWLEAVTGLPPAVALTTLLALALAIAAAVWLWYTRRKRPE